MPFDASTATLASAEPSRDVAGDLSHAANNTVAIARARATSRRYHRASAAERKNTAPAALAPAERSRYLTAVTDWAPSSWQSRPAAQQVVYRDPAALATIVDEIG